MELLKAVEENSQSAFLKASEELMFFERLLSLRSRSDLDDDIKFLHQAYEEDMLTFSMCEEQLDQLKGYTLDTGLAQLDPRCGECTSSMVNSITM